MWIYKGNNHCNKKKYMNLFKKKKKNLHFISHYLSLSQNYSINLTLKVRESMFMKVNILVDQNDLLYTEFFLKLYYESYHGS